MESLIQSMEQHDLSDRVALTVRICSDGNREWLDASGRIALVFFENGYWWARESNKNVSRICCDSEKEALDTVLFHRLVEIRKEAHRQALIRIQELEEEG